MASSAGAGRVSGPWRCGCCCSVWSRRSRGADAARTAGAGGRLGSGVIVFSLALATNDGGVAVVGHLGPDDRAGDRSDRDGARRDGGQPLVREAASLVVGLLSVERTGQCCSCRWRRASVHWGWRLAWCRRRAVPDCLALVLLIVRRPGDLNCPRTGGRVVRRRLAAAEATRWR